ncbi:glycosyltransferase [Chromobacterium violaceum]|uniref:glycosyltransferase n=1 Tax=Chromobacterium violaceum TaxID=536 RepID=UPI001BE5E033|nr:glycosyltransferase [Chromobacterium violaceum]MBT2869258.1 glycosyltransferase [Chromobacterium violaceum]
MKKYLFVMDYLPFPSHRDGVSLINYNILKYAPKNIKVDLLLFEDVPDLDKQNIKDIFETIDTIYTFKPLSKLKQRFVNIASLSLFGKFLFQSEEAALFLKSNEDNYDKIFITPLVSHVNPSCYKNVFLNAVDSFSALNKTEFDRTHSLKSFFKYWLYRFFEKRLSNSVNYINFVNNKDKEFVCKNNNGRAVALNISNGVDADFFSFQGIENRKEKSIIFTGNFSYMPNRDAAFYLVKNILPVLRKKYPDVTLYLVGKEPPEELVCQDGVVVTGYVDDIRPFYWQASVFLCPLRMGAGVKNKVLEAMATGVPIVSSSIGVDGIEGMKRDQNFILADSLDDTISAIVRLFESKSTRNLLSENARKTIDDGISWGEVSSRYWKVLI